ncbi:MAG: hypothetical protein ABIO86_09430 [Sphingomonas sp.]
MSVEFPHPVFADEIIAPPSGVLIEAVSPRTTTRSSFGFAGSSAFMSGPAMAASWVRWAAV